ncbi:methyltransferase domain-containing protein [Myxococcota bacterium]|nr:methyltransferase domain-containing protein [Myxococcota bacterium]
MMAVDKGLYLTRQIGLTALLEPMIRAWHFVLDPKLAKPTRTELRAIEGRYRALLERDLANVEGGYYPRALLFEFPVSDFLKKLPKGIFEFPKIYRRRATQSFRDLPPVAPTAEYPDYYLRNFHWQSGGWLTDRSAQLYDISVELLFLGTADVMRRMVIPPVADAARGHEHVRVLDVACGTGRFLRQLHGALPDAKLYGLDLSPNYLKEARKTLADVPGVGLVAENAENLPFRDGSFDVVTSIFLFHELPGDARRNVMREALRVLRPGGTVVLCDSAQLADSAEINGALERFPHLYHEPYYKGYVRDPLEAALADVGFDVQRTEVHFVSKVVVAKKPALAG